MLISCENCKDVFEVNERHLNSKGVTALCPHCDHKHRVKRIVVPYSLSGDSEEDTEPYDVQDNEGAIVVEHLKNETDGNDLEPIESKSDLVFVSKDGAPDINMDGPKGQVEMVNNSYHIDQERRKGERGTIFDRFVSVDFLYLLIAGILIIGFIVYFSLT